MQVWEAHKALSLALGDSVGYETFTLQSLNIPAFDGVRFSYSQRCSALYRAMLQVLQDLMKATAGMPRKQAVEILYRMLPTYISNVRIASNDVQAVPGFPFLGIDFTAILPVIPNPLLLLTAELSLPPFVSYPIPIKYNHIEALGLRNSRNIQRADIYGEAVTTGLRIYSFSIDLVNINIPFNILISYIPIPTNPETQTTQSLITFEESLLPKVISLATLYCQMESQDIDSQQVIPLILQQGGGQ